jgi:hypothetical protein
MFWFIATDILSETKRRGDSSRAEVWRSGAEGIQLGWSGTSKQVRVRKPFEP